MTTLPAYSSETKERAYRDWRTSGSCRKTGRTLNIPEGTVISWCRSEGWIARKADDDERELAVIQSHALSRLVGESLTLTERLLELSESGTKEDKVRFDATRLALAIIGIQPVQLVKQSIDTQPASIATPPYRILNPEEQQAAGARLAGIPETTGEVG